MDKPLSFEEWRETYPADFGWYVQAPPDGKTILSSQTKNAEDAFNAARRGLAGPPEWISVKDKMPEVRTNVLVLYRYYKDSPQEIMIGQLTEKPKQGNQYKRSLLPQFWVDGTGRGAFSKPKNDRVSHWMPLPDILSEYE